MPKKKEKDVVEGDEINSFSLSLTHSLLFSFLFDSSRQAVSDTQKSNVKILLDYVYNDDDDDDVFVMCYRRGSVFLSFCIGWEFLCY